MCSKKQPFVFTFAQLHLEDGLTDATVEVRLDKEGEAERYVRQQSVIHLSVPFQAGRTECVYHVPVDVSVDPVSGKDLLVGPVEVDPILVSAFRDGRVCLNGEWDIEPQVIPQDWHVYCPTINFFWTIDGRPRGIENNPGLNEEEDDEERNEESSSSSESKETNTVIAPASTENDLSEVTSSEDEDKLDQDGDTKCPGSQTDEVSFIYTDSNYSVLEGDDLDFYLQLLSTMSFILFEEDPIRLKEIEDTLLEAYNSKTHQAVVPMCDMMDKLGDYTAPIILRFFTPSGREVRIPLLKEDMFPFTSIQRLRQVVEDPEYQSSHIDRLTEDDVVNDTARLGPFSYDQFFCTDLPEHGDRRWGWISADPIDILVLNTSKNAFSLPVHTLTDISRNRVHVHGQQQHRQQ